MEHCKAYELHFKCQFRGEICHKCLPECSTDRYRAKSSQELTSAATWFMCEDDKPDCNAASQRETARSYPEELYSLENQRS